MKEDTYDEHWVSRVRVKSLNCTPETSIALFVMLTNEFK